MTTYTEPQREYEAALYEEPNLSREAVTIASGSGVLL